MSSPGRARAAARFVAVITVVVVAYYAASATALFQEHVLADHLVSSAGAATALLRAFGLDATTSGTLIALSNFRLEVVRGCDALDASAFLAAAILAFPASLGRKLAGIAAGIAALVALNVVRIAALVVVGSRWRSSYDSIHLEVFQPAFVVAVFLLWVGWARWASGPLRGGRVA